LDKVISRHIRKALLLSKGGVEGPGGTAKLLGVNPSTLRARIRKYGIKFNRSLSGTQLDNRSIKLCDYWKLKIKLNATAMETGARGNYENG
jgi:hypothetical protein